MSHGHLPHLVHLSFIFHFIFYFISPPFLKTFFVFFPSPSSTALRSSSEVLLKVNALTLISPKFIYFFFVFRQNMGLSNPSFFLQ